MSDPKDPHAPVTRVEHDALKDTVETLVKGLNSFREDVGAELKDLGVSFTHTIERMAGETRADIGLLFSKRDKDLREQSRVPYPMLTLIFSAILAVGAVLAWNMNRVEGEAKQGDRDIDAVVQREMRLLDKSVEQRAEHNHEAVEKYGAALVKLDEKFTAYDRENVEKLARGDERIKILTEQLRDAKAGWRTE